MSAATLEKGTKTVLPSKASAKITCRLVSKQNPDRIARSLPRLRDVPPAAGREGRIHQRRRQLAYSTPPTEQSGAADRSPRLGAPNGKKPAALVGSGGFIPIVGSFKRELGMDSLLVGFALDYYLAQKTAQRKVRPHVLP